MGALTESRSFSSRTFLFQDSTTGGMMQEVSPASNGSRNDTISDVFSLVAVVNCTAGTLMTVITILGQVMVFVVVSRDPRLRTPSNYFIVSLALADLLIGVVSMPVWTVFSVLGYWPFPQLACDIWGAVDVSLCNVSIYTILFISIDRYLSLKYPLSYRVNRTPGKAKVALIAIWVSCIIVFGTFIAVTQYVYGQERDPMSCQMYHVRNVPLTFLIAGVSLWVSVLTTLIIYLMIYSIVTKVGRIDSQFDGSKRKSNRRGQTSENTHNVDSDFSDAEYENATVISVISGAATNAKAASNPSGKAVKLAQSTRRQQEGSEEKQRKAVKTIALLLLSLAVCWLPLSIFLVIESMHPGYLSVWWFIGSYWLGYINSMINPICYAVGNPSFRETVGKCCSSG